jgi:hypothetical protein
MNIIFIKSHILNDQVWKLVMEHVFTNIGFEDAKSTKQ